MEASTAVAPVIGVSMKSPPGEAAGAYPVVTEVFEREERGKGNLGKRRGRESRRPLHMRWREKVLKAKKTLVDEATIADCSQL